MSIGPHLTLGLLSTCLLLGCAEQVPACPNESDVREADGRCHPPGDAGLDASVATDGGHDAGPSCECDGGLHCTADFRCVQCTLAEHCGAGEQCSDDDNTCVQCNEDSQCSDGVCVAHSCTPGCRRCVDEDPARPYCSGTTECGECRPGGTDCPDDHSCDPSTLSCTETVIGSLGLCEPCVASEECGTHRYSPAGSEVATAMACVGTTFGGAMMPAGSFCLVNFSAIAGAESCPNGVPRRQTSRPVEGGADEEYCHPLPIATCEAFAKNGTMCGSVGECGAASFDDSTCVTDCRQRCALEDSSSDCPDGYVCRTSPSGLVCLR